MTDTTGEPGHLAPTGPEPQLRDLVRVRFVLEEHQEHPGVVIGILRRPRIHEGDRYRVRYRDGITAWHWRDELAVRDFTTHREIVQTDLAAIRTILDHAITAAQEHDLLHRALSDVFDTLTATATTYLGGNLDTPAPAAAPAD
ncbi:hypothetical protein EV385_0524 [Krasilnikovia cinnamomea]|uniref:Uncharacterized protein n=1 Tax=Krasilnikovia cinnamomea TaxID=349313 RepID=A0A4Q7ZDP1_9ACTN|nr:hypothetical protein [Krasilnikovia cinnamomea]RZU48800.1 hypothetical protein EV385_0524 [Krasilnikovia cinnamomea]